MSCTCPRHLEEEFLCVEALLPHPIHTGIIVLPRGSLRLLRRDVTLVTLRDVLIRWRSSQPEAEIRGLICLFETAQAGANDD